MANLNSLKCYFLLLLVALSATNSAAQTALFAWGDNRYGELGIGSFDTAAPYSRATPAAVSSVLNLAGLADGFYHSVAFAADGTVWTWGYNYYGQLGLGSFDTASPSGKNAPTQIPNFTGVVAVAAGTNHSLALKSDGTVWAWGWNTFGQLGDGSGANQNKPVKVTGLSNVTAIAAGGIHSMALLADGSVMAWGGNNYGEIGDGTTLSRPTPVRVFTATAIACGQYYSLAMAPDGTLTAWGSNSNGQIGDGTTVTRKLPTPVSGISNVAFFTGGGFTTLAIKNDGSLWAWGWNVYGQVGDGTTTDRSLPTQVKGVTHAVAIASGQAHCLALDADGAVWTWGWNAYGQSGCGMFSTVAPFGFSTPQKIQSIGGVTAIAGGGNRAHALISSIPTVSISGVITLEGLTRPYLPHTLQFQMRPLGGAGFLRSAPMNPDGSFTVSGVQPGKYTLWIKGAKWLASLAMADASSGDAVGVTATLTGGDANNDNSVDTSDFGLLVGVYNNVYNPASAPADDFACDFNEDGVIDTSDFGLLVGDYGQVGAN